MALFTTLHFVDPDLILLRGVPVTLGSMPFFKPSRPRISAVSIALWVVSPADSNSNSIVAVIFIGSLHKSRPTCRRSQWSMVVRIVALAEIVRVLRSRDDPPQYADHDIDDERNDKRLG